MGVSEEFILNIPPKRLFVEFVIELAPGVDIAAFTTGINNARLSSSINTNGSFDILLLEDQDI
jgi:hypothetical protein